MKICAYNQSDYKDIEDSILKLSKTYNYVDKFKYAQYTERIMPEIEFYTDASYSKQCFYIPEGFKIKSVDVEETIERTRDAYNIQDSIDTVKYKVTISGSIGEDLYVFIFDKLMCPTISIKELIYSESKGTNSTPNAFS